MATTKTARMTESVPKKTATKRTASEKKPASKELSVVKAKASGPTRSSGSTSRQPANAPEVRGIDRRKLVSMVNERLASEGKSVQTFASEIGMPARVAENVFQGTGLPASHRVVQFLHYLGIAAGDAPRTDLNTVRPKGNHIFISYSHRDTEYLERLLVHLKPLQREGLIDTWVDMRLQAGDRWRAEIDAALKKARVAILLVSADFLASDFVFKNELPPLLKAAEESGTLIVPVVLKPCRYTRSKELRDFQAINPPDEPLSVLDENGRELLYDSIAQRVEAVFN